jgi:hypothetical protein
MTGTFWKVLLCSAGAGMVLFFIDGLIGGKADKSLFPAVLVVVALAVGFECVVMAIKQLPKQIAERVDEALASPLDKPREMVD